MLYSGHVHPSPPWCVALLNTEDSTHWILAPTEAGLVSSKCLKLLLAVGQRCLLAEELCHTTITLQNKFSGDFSRSNFTVYEPAIGWQ